MFISNKYNISFDLSPSGKLRVRVTRLLYRQTIILIYNTDTKSYINLT